ncbi:nucleotide-diphospho-sugar transferases superfamily protein [Actinidia rufa]|uniref:ceramide glucosyltransferase n=1 Tax=Actinidia rufa TaxID=165716 RepID=A0A7J0FI62_9ERIC|nr:nucleotide-diphospho-sugar transferases superfamily protein [Actinidia rufa]
METMSPFDSLDAVIISASRAFCTPLAIFIQIQQHDHVSDLSLLFVLQGCFICLTLAFGWACAAYVRSREIRQMKNSMRGGNSFAFLSHDINDLEHSTQVKLPSVTVVMPLKGFGEHNLHNWRSQITSLYGGPLEFLFVVESTEDPAYHAVNRLLADYKDDVDAKIIVAGLSTTCSQKIHNQLIGVDRMHKDTKYVLFLDDDVRLHPGSIGALTAEMEKNPEIFIQTGYPLDLPSGSLGSYCIYEYHMMHADDFRNDRHGVVSKLQDGGYSDDMTLAAIAGAHKRLITSPPVAVFPHPLASDLSFSRYWNYLRKQTFVLESYATKVNWIMNRALFSFHCYLSWGFVAPYLMAVVHVAAALRVRSKGYSLEDTNFTSCGLLLASCLAMCTFIELLSMWNLTRIEVRLCNLLSPEAPPLSLATYNWCLVFIAMLVDNFLYPISAFRSHFSQSINWSGIRYHLKDGKISKIDRSKGKGPKFTDLGGKHLYGKKGAPHRASILGALSRSLAHWRQAKKFDA